MTLKLIISTFEQLKGFFVVEIVRNSGQTGTFLKFPYVVELKKVFIDAR